MGLDGVEWVRTEVRASWRRRRGTLMPAPARAGPDVSQEPGFQPEASIGDTQIPDLSSTASKDAH